MLTAVVVAAFLLLLGSASWVAAQPVGDYLSLVDRYLDDADDAIGSLAKWRRPMISDAVDRIVRSLSVQQRLAAAMLHSDVAALIVDTAAGDAAFHIGVASRLLDGLHDRADFVHRWYEFVAMLYVSRGRFKDALAAANDGLTKYPDAAALHAVRGTVAELRVLFDYPNLRGEAITSDRENFRVTRALEAAAADYRRALTLNPGFVVARLRLGWIHLLLRDKRAAGDLTAVLEVSSDDSIRYLAHLFLGALAEREGRIADARAAYEAARAADARSQTACVALSHVEGALGQSMRARAIALECIALERDEDPWWRLGALDPRTVDWLHEEARRR